MSRKLFAINAFIFLLNFTCYSENNPDIFPSRIILNLTATPSNSMAVTWRTQSSAKTAEAYIVESNDGVDLQANARRVIGTSESIVLEDGKTIGYAHSIVFTNLKPKTKYAYKVGDGTTWSEWNQFETASSGNDSFQFVYFGDPQDQLIEYCSRVFRSAYRTAPLASFWLIAGDLVSSPRLDEEWQEFYYAAGWIPGNMPMIMTPGNHEYQTYESNRSLTPLWKPHFTLPENGPTCLGETCYYADYQGSRFISLNGNEQLELQAKWLDSLLAKTTSNWTIIMMHQPLYNIAKGRNDKDFRDIFGPVFDKHQVDLVLQGHDHSYGRTVPIFNGRVAKHNEKGTVYVISVSGPKTYYINPKFQKYFVKMDTGKQWFQVIDVQPKQLQYIAYTVNGEIYDSFVLKK